VKPEPVYLLILNKAHTQEEFIRGSMTKNPYSSVDVGPLMRDVKNKICNQLDLIGLLEDDYGMELLVGGSIISLDLSISQVYEQVWRKHHGQTQHCLSNVSAITGASSIRDCPPMTVTYRLQVSYEDQCFCFLYFKYLCFLLSPSWSKGSCVVSTNTRNFCVVFDILMCIYYILSFNIMRP
jgi:hypothetical protein